MGNRVVYLPAYEAEVEYLESTGTQRIDTGITLSNYDGFEIRYSPTQASTFIGNSEVIGSRNPEGSAVILGFNADDSTTRNIGCRVYIRWGTLAISANPSSIASIDEWYTANVNVSNRIASDGLGNSVTLDDIPQSTNSLFIFAGRQVSSGFVYAKVKIAYCKFYSNSILVRDFIPVRIGTTGYMYDKVSRQLFANAGTGRFVLGNDVANATVPQLRHVVYFGGQRCVGFEKVYEKCAWLKGRNGAYIDTNYKIVTVQDAFQGKIRYDGSVENPDKGKQYICGAAIPGVGEPYAYTYIAVNNKLGCIYKLNNSNWDYTSVANEHTFMMSNDGNQTTAIDNGTTYIFNNELPEQLIDNTCYLFRANRPTSSYFHGDIAYFRISDPTFSVNRINMFPCRLLVDIPAILDGNGIARQAGTCGMWDTVSGRFFGNVADRGTFDVVYFEEGVDYEVH